MRFIRELDQMIAYEPGQPLELVMRRFGLSEVVKLASNELPVPPFPEVQEAIIAAIDGLNRYPDGHCTDLRAAIAAHYGRDGEEVVIGNGSCELLMLIGDAVLERGDELVFAAPSFTVYEDISRRHGAAAVRVPTVDFVHDLDAMADAVTARTKLLIVCNPNNPTGTYVPVADVQELVDRVPDDVLVIIDEAYNEFVSAPDAQDSLELQTTHENVVVLRTFSKIYGLCGLRVGYGLGAPALKEALDKLRQPFNVNRLAQVAAIEALKHQDKVRARAAANAEVRAYMAARLAARGRATVPSEANFMLVDVRGLSVPPEQVFEALLAKGVIVRDGHALGCPGWARVSVGTRAETDFFLAKLAELEPGAGPLSEGRRS
ncbi:MAG TPA: histidinol-phosphate transaminase [Thermoleophilia bacterium]|nr:histidinol-phosphate transaminase [Thermoleophilia bacterium]